MLWSMGRPGPTITRKEGCGAVSSFVYQNSLDICAAVPLLLPQFKHNTVPIRINFIGIITGITQPVRFNV